MLAFVPGSGPDRLSGLSIIRYLLNVLLKQSGILLFFSHKPKEGWFFNFGCTSREEQRLWCYHEGKGKLWGRNSHGRSLGTLVASIECSSCPGKASTLDGRHGRLAQVFSHTRPLLWGRKQHSARSRKFNPCMSACYYGRWAVKLVGAGIPNDRWKFL